MQNLSIFYSQHVHMPCLGMGCCVLFWIEWGQRFAPVMRACRNLSDQAHIGLKVLHVSWHMHDCWLNISADLTVVLSAESHSAGSPKNEWEAPAGWGRACVRTDCPFDDTTALKIKLLYCVHEEHPWNLYSSWKQVL